MNKKISTETQFNINGTDDKTLRIIYDLHSLLCETNLTFAEGMAMLFGGCDAVRLKELERKGNLYVFKHWTPTRKRNLLFAINSMRKQSKLRSVIQMDRICAILMRILQADECLGGLQKSSLYEAFDNHFTKGGEFWFMPIEQFNPGSVFRVGLRGVGGKHGITYNMNIQTNTGNRSVADLDDMLFGDVLRLIRAELKHLLNQNIGADEISRSIAIIKHVQNFGTDTQKKALRDNGITFHI
jgi:hypothetical protein